MYCLTPLSMESHLNLTFTGFIFSNIFEHNFTTSVTNLSPITENWSLNVHVKSQQSGVYPLWPQLQLYWLAGFWLRTVAALFCVLLRTCHPMAHSNIWSKIVPETLHYILSKWLLLSQAKHIGHEILWTTVSFLFKLWTVKPILNSFLELII